jgi:inhibitor of KinA sporulation pathway (predicted exonuclease)
MKDMNFMAFDMEFNQPSNSIIQVGIGVYYLQSGELLEEYMRYIYQDEVINPEIIQLTGVKQEHVDGGIDFDQLHKEIIELHNKYNCFRNPIVWGGGDSRALRNALGIDDKWEDDPYVFGRRELDAKTLFISWCMARDLNHKSGLAKSMTRLGMRFEGKKHDALDDAKNTFRIYRMLLKKMRE